MGRIWQIYSSRITPSLLRVYHFIEEWNDKIAFFFHCRATGSYLFSSDGIDQLNISGDVSA